MPEYYWYYHEMSVIVPKYHRLVILSITVSTATYGAYLHLAGHGVIATSSYFVIPADVRNVRFMDQVGNPIVGLSLRITPKLSSTIWFLRLNIYLVV